MAGFGTASTVAILHFISRSKRNLLKCPFDPTPLRRTTTLAKFQLGLSYNDFEVHQENIAGRTRGGSVNRKPRTTICPINPEYGFMDVSVNDLEVDQEYKPINLGQRQP